MAQGTEPIRQDIDELRGSMSETLEQIESRVRDRVDTTVDTVKRNFDLRRQVQSKPWLSLMVAMGVGFALGSRGGGGDKMPRQAQQGEAMRYYPQSSSEQRSYRQADYGQTDYRNTSSQSSQSSSQKDEHPVRDQIGHQVNRLASMAAPFGDELDAMAAAAMRTAVRVIRETLRDSAPKLSEEYETIRRERGINSFDEESTAGDELSRAVNEPTWSGQGMGTTSRSDLPS